MNKKKNWIEWLMRSYRITFFIIILLFVFGIWGFEQMPKAEFPTFTVRQGVIAVVYPGATAEEVEEQVAKPLERYLFTFDEVKRHKTTTTSSNGMCVCLVELEDDVDNKEEVWSTIRHGLNEFKAQNLPSGVLALAVNDDFGSSSAMLLALEGDGRSYRDLKKYSDDLADRLRRLESVSNVVLYGDTKEQISIILDSDRLAAYGIGRLNILQNLRSAGLTTMSGSISGWQKDVPIHVKPTARTVEEIENMIIYSNADNTTVRIRDVAEVKREYDISESYIDFNGRPCVLLSLEMKDGNNIVHYGRDVQKVIDDYKADVLPDDVNVTRIVDQSKVVDDSVVDFMVNLLESMVIIVLVMLVLFPWRTAVVAGIIVPLSTFVSIGIMYMVGIPLNTVTLAGLIIVLGMVVDNSIVVLDGYLEYLNIGYSRWHAAAESARHYFMPMLLATLCIAIIFFPILFTLTGTFRDFVEWLPWTVLINLMVSLLLAVTVIPVLEFLVIKRKKSGDDKKKKRDITQVVQDCYLKVLGWNFRHPWLTIFGTVAMIVICMAVIAPNMKVRIMPYADREQFAVEITLPVGSGLADTRAVADSIYNVLMAEDDVVSVTRFIGCSSPRFHAAYAPKVAGRNYAQFIVNVKSVKDTERLVDKYEPIYSERFPNAFVKFKQLDFQNFDSFEYRFYGEDIDSLRCAADQMMAYLRQKPELMNVHADWQDMRPIIDVELKPVEGSLLGMNRTLTELQLAANTGSIAVGSVWEGDYEVPIKMKDVNHDNFNCDDIENLHLSTPLTSANALVGGASTVPLRQFANVAPTWSQTSIVHRLGERCLTVTCDLKRGYLTTPIHEASAEFIANDLHLPHGVRYETGGEPEDNTRTIVPIGAGIAIAIVIIFFFLLFNFSQYKLTITCLVALLLCLPGAIIGLWMMNRAVGLTSVFGLITLMGMIMRNEILIFEHANEKMRKGMSARDAAYDAGSRRMVPIFLTTATTAVGVVPMIIAATSFWMPVGVSIFAGGIGSLVLVTTVLPVVYWKLNEKKPKK